MNARQLEVFCAIMRYRTLTSAARALNVSQPALSQILLHTEDVLELKLFRRVRGRLVPTPEAETLYPEAERLFRQMEVLRRYAGDLKKGVSGLVRIAASGPPSLSILPQAVQNFRAAAPAVKLISYAVPVSVITTMIADGDADIGLAMYDVPMPLLDTETIARTEVACVMRKDHPLAGKAVITPGDLDGLSLITYRAETLPRMAIEQAFAQTGITLRVDVEVDVSIIAMAFVRTGGGVALVDGLTPWATFPDMVMRPIRPTLPLPVCLLTSNRRPLSRPQELMVFHVRQIARNLIGSKSFAGILSAAERPAS
jgi:DNA-binding transcriptional LysR family regulator